ncbi:MAG: RNA polymerase sigma factor [Oscillospiraceae bacterium]|nr:RNA polymerase sigma factor [Oscillospiraceae bacterium]
MQINDIENIMDYLFSAALKKCGNFGNAEDLTSEVILAAMKYPNEIKDIKKWLSGVLNHKYYDMLRRKYKLPTVSINLITEDIPYIEEEQADVPSADEIRREVAYLSGKYREVIVRHYLNGEKVQDIADWLGIPKGTVLSRLSAGREQIRKGFDSMERYEKQSYQPERLEISCNGCMGLNNEPFSLVKGDMLKQNILIAAYEKPVTCVEIALALGIPTAYIENAVSDLVKSELMQRKGDKVFTDFMIAAPEQILKSLDAQIEFSKRHYNTIWSQFSEFLAEIRESTKNLCLRDSEQRKLEYFFVLHLFSNGIYQAVQRIVPSKEEYPLRPDGGKWIAFGNRYPLDFDFENYKFSKYCYGGERRSYEENFFSSKSVDLHIYDAQPDLNKYQHGDTLLSDEIFMKILYVIYKGIPFNYTGIDPIYLERIPHLAECGILRMENNIPELDIPVISKQKYDELEKLHINKIYEFADMFEPLVREIMPMLKIEIPKHLESHVAEFRKYTAYAFPMAVIKEAMERGDFYAENCTPPMVMAIDE